MKKKIIILVLLVSCIASSIFVLTLIKNRTVYATDINLLVNQITLPINDEFCLSNDIFEIEPSNYTERPVFSCDDENLANIDIFSGKITPIKIGECNVIITVKTEDGETLSKKLKLIICEALLYYDNVTISTTKMELTQNQLVCLNTSKIGTSNVQPVVKIANNNVEYDFITDTIWAKNVGSDVLTITYKLSNGTLKTFKIEITIAKKKYYEEDVKINIDTQNYVCVEYFTASDKDECNIYIEFGDEVISISEYEYKHIIIVPICCGEAKVVVDSPTQKCVYYVTVETTV